MDSRFTGAFTALATPFTADGSALDLARLEAAIDRQAAGGITGVVPCGTTGESPTLTPHEHRSMVERTIALGRERGLLVIAGAGSNNTAHALELHRLAADLGADAALHVCPYYNKPTQQGLIHHFTTLADGADLPIVVYNIPGRSGCCLDVDSIVRLAEHRNIVAVKDATGGLSSAIDVLRRTDLVVLSGDDPLTLPMMALGGGGVVSVVSNVLPAAVAGLCHAMLSDDLPSAREHHATLLPMAQALLALDSNPVPLKTVLAILGHDSGAVRAPLVPIGTAAHCTLEGLVAGHFGQVEQTA